MIYLFFSIVISSFLYVIFKLFARFKVNTLQAIVVNYFVAGGMGFLLFENEVNIAKIPQKPWFIGAVLLGILFISVFNLMALTSQKNGVSVASVSSKMSIALPVIFAVIVYNEQLSLIKIAGIILALIAVYLASVKKQTTTLNTKSLFLPFLLFFGSGMIDTGLKYVETNYVMPDETPIFSAFIFCCAAIIGVLLISWQGIKGKLNIKKRTLLWGVILGVPNYFSIYYLLKALQSDVYNSSIIFTVNNVAIVMFSTILGILIFKEKLTKKNWVGIFIAIISIFLVAS